MKNITLIGSGNVATHLGLSLIKKGFKIKQVWSRTRDNAEILAKKLDSSATDSINNLENTDLYILAVKDDCLESIIQQLDQETNIIHVSGSINIEMFNNKFKHYGVFYPLQTFNKEVTIDFSAIPIFIEANTSKFQNQLLNMGNKLSNTVVIMNSEKRRKLHVSAVFACNFTTHMFSIADAILHKENIDFQLLLPLINQTVKKLNQSSPAELQTGPAIRKDRKLIKEHINSITDKETQDLYKLISNSIMKKNK